jgi:hypothetical protein
MAGVPEDARFKCNQSELDLRNTNLYALLLAEVATDGASIWVHFVHHSTETHK